MFDRSAAQRSLPNPRADSLGGLLLTLQDSRPTVIVRAGWALAILGILLMVGCQNAFGAVLIVVGLVTWVVGVSRKKNRLCLYQHGIAQIKGDKVDVVRWADVVQVQLERETQYGSGLAYAIWYHCSLQRTDGTWLLLDAVRLTSKEIKAIRETARLTDRDPGTAAMMEPFHLGPWLGLGGGPNLPQDPGQT